MKLASMNLWLLQVLASKIFVQDLSLNVMAKVDVTIIQQVYPTGWQPLGRKINFAAQFLRHLKQGLKEKELAVVQFV